ncbi:MAG TPA: ATP-dependent Clp protease proteolytic subunit [Acidimicrobiales bacterium]|nr:ATP-dependent Clp protease proteolytic subunit [Acidimicrobiales bacterium]
MSTPPSMRDWLESELYQRRTIQLAGVLADEVGGRLAATLMTMDAEGDDAVEFRMTSQGGSIDAAFSLIDTIDLLGVPVRAVALGRVAGPAAFVFALCPVRFAAPSASLQLLEPNFAHTGRPDELVRASVSDQKRLDDLIERLVGVSGRARSEITADIRSGRVFTASEARQAGLVDEIAVAPNAGHRGNPSAV